MNRSSKSASITALFDYDSLEATQRSIIQQRTGEIRERLRRSAQDIWEVGQKLSDVRSRLKYGQFLTWLKVEFGWSQRTAYNFIKVYETFGDRFANLAKVDIATSLLYQLASPSVPDDLREQVIEAAKKGKKITAKELRSTIKQRKQLKSAAIEERPAQPEIVTVIAQDANESTGSTNAISAIQPRPTLQSIANPIKVPNVKSGWYRVGQEHLLFCGDTASRDFVQQMPPAKLAIAVTGSDWDHDWLIDQIDSVVVVPQGEFTVETLEQLLQMLSKSQDWVVLPWLPQAEMIGIAHRLGRRIYAGDIDLARCRSAIAASGLAAKSTKLSTLKVAGQVG
ncbi:MAG: DUF3102 domain-containing protein [Cyanobacteria bacterium J06632_22]